MGIGENIVDCDKCTKYSGVEIRIESLTKEIEKLIESDQKKSEALSERPRTRHLITMLSIILALALSVPSIQYAITTDQVEEVKKDQKEQKKEQNEQYKSLNKKTDDIKDSMHEMNAMMREMRALIKGRTINK
jgi:putative methionine-R-sulfoxide reductase with GAF domain